MEIGFDIISDLYLEPDESFNWENKATSLYCLIPGNVSSHPITLLQTLKHLSQHYHGVFFIPGPYDTSEQDYQLYSKLIGSTLSHIKNVTCLYHNVIILNGIAIVGVNGWIGDVYGYDDIAANELARLDYEYLCETFIKLTRHIDIKKIIVLSSTIPNREMYFGTEPEVVKHQTGLLPTLSYDSQFKVRNWVFGNSNKNVDIFFNSIHFTSNPYLKRRPYYAKRIDIEI